MLIIVAVQGYFLGCPFRKRKGDYYEYVRNFDVASGGIHRLGLHR